MKWLVKKKCFNYYEYETWRNFENADDNYQNCVGLDF